MPAMDMEESEEMERIAARKRAADAADLTINVQNTGRPSAPEMPAYRPVSMQPAATSEMVATALAAPVIQRRPAPQPEHEVRWGGIAKGAAIVAGVALVGVVGLWAFGGLAASTGVVGTALHSISLIPSFLQGFFVDGMFASMGFGGTAAAVAGGALTTKAVIGGLGAGAAVATAAPVATHAMVTPDFSSTPDTATLAQTKTAATASSTQSPPAAGQNSDTLIASLSAKKAALSASQTAGAAADGAYAHDLVDDALANSTTTKITSKMAHHVTEEMENSPPRSRSVAQALERASSRGLIAPQAAQGDWASRTGRKEQAPIAPRNSEYAQEIATERSQLDSALASSTR